MKKLFSRSIYYYSTSLTENIVPFYIDFVGPAVVRAFRKVIHLVAFSALVIHLACQLFILLYLIGSHASASPQ